MRRVRYAVAMSLDGDIAGPKGQEDWMVIDRGSILTPTRPGSTRGSWGAKNGAEGQKVLCVPHTRWSSASRPTRAPRLAYSTAPLSSASRISGSYWR